MPTLRGWTITPSYESAREVGGDFHDFISLPNGHLGLVIADVTDKGVPVALVMATTPPCPAGRCYPPGVARRAAALHHRRALQPPQPRT